jgi:hypothetical protein
MASAAVHVGFLSILQESGGSYLGGYLVTNQWGRPLEFRLSTALQPNRLQQILYSVTLLPYICADLIGKTLIDKTTTAAHFVLTDHPAALDLRPRLGIPMAWLSTSENQAEMHGPGLKPRVFLITNEGPRLFCHSAHVSDAESVRSLLAQMDGVDLGEPFGRIREAIAEARKMGVTHRA